MDLAQIAVGVPYDVERLELYTPEELLHRDDDGRSLDDRIYGHFVAHGARQPAPASEALAQRVHDYGVEEALIGKIGRTPGERLERRIVGVMGGNAVGRRDRVFHVAARVGWMLAQANYRVATGGGPGVMEAANLGAMLAQHSMETLDEAVEVLARSPGWKEDPHGYLKAAFDVVDAYGPRSPSLAIPTWFYGDEPTNAFASDIAKYFSNGLREEGLLAICRHGVVFAAGGAATLQEAFTDHAHNHNVVYESRGPMVSWEWTAMTASTTFFAKRPTTSSARCWPSRILLRRRSRPSSRGRRWLWGNRARNLPETCRRCSSDRRLVADSDHLHHDEHRGSC